MDFLNGWTIDVHKVPKYTNIINQTFIQKVDPILLKMICKSDDKLFQYSKDTIIKLANEKTGELKVHYESSYQGLGYPEPVNNKSILYTGSHSFRQTIFEYMGYKEIDIVKAYATLMYEVAKKNGIILENIKYYIDHFDELVDDIFSYYESYGIDLERREKRLGIKSIKSYKLKGFFIFIINGGTYNKWFYGGNLVKLTNFGSQSKDNCIFKSSGIAEGFNGEIPPPHPFFIKLIQDYTIFTKYVVDNNYEIMKIINTSCPLLTSNMKENAVYQLFCSTIIFHATATAYDFMVSRKITNPSRAILEIDALIIEDDYNLLDDSNLSDIIKDLNLHIYKKTGIPFKYIYKPWKVYSKKMIEERRNPFYVMWFNLFH